MKHLANIISLSRIALLLALFFSYDNAPLFLVLYIVCGITDILDGFVARKTGSESEFGARLDSLADLLLFSVVTGALVTWLGDEVWAFLPWVIATAAIRGVNLAIVAFKYQSFAILHTYGNKLTGLLLFISPLFVVTGQFTLLWPLAVAAVASALEETVIHLTSPVLDLNRHSIFTRPK